LFERTCVSTEIQFIKHFIESVLVETNQLFGRNSHVILMQQTCGHRSSRVVGSKSRALAFDFPVRIWYVFLILKCREESDLGMCMRSVHAKRMLLCSADFQRILQPNTFYLGSRHCTVAFSLQVPNSCTDLDLTLLYISILRTHAKFVRQIK